MEHIGDLYWWHLTTGLFHQFCKWLCMLCHGLSSHGPQFHEWFGWLGELRLSHVINVLSEKMSFSPPYAPGSRTLLSLSLSVVCELKWMSSIFILFIWLNKAIQHRNHLTSSTNTQLEELRSSKVVFARFVARRAQWHPLSLRPALGCVAGTTVQALAWFCEICHVSKDGIERNIRFSKKHCKSW